MPLNVDFLTQFSQWKTIHESAIEAETNIYSKPRTSLFYSRVTLERAVRWLYRNDDYLQYPQKEKPMLGDLIHERTFQDNLSPGMLQPLKLIMKLGNQAVHDDSPVDSSHALLVFEHLFMFLNWLQRYYGEPPIKGLSFNSELVPKQTSSPIRESLAELTILEQQIAEKDAKLAVVEEENARLRKQLAELQQQGKTTREPKPRITISPESEAKTRQLLIDIMLREAKWDPQGENVREYAVQGMPNKTKQGFCDYVLWGDNGLPLAVIEVKSTIHDAKKGKKQAELYANQLEQQFGQRPLIFYTNGYETYFWDDTFYPPRKVSSFYRKDELEWLIQRRKLRKPLQQVLPNSKIAGRVYQIEAIRRVGETFEGARRHALLVMATGTGKTRTAIALVDFLKRAGWVKNVLFLADRRELVKQAYGEFKKHLPNETLCNLLEEKDDTSARIYFSTYQTMLGFVQPNPGEPLVFGVGQFDLIIIDEAHRSIYNKYGLVFQYFDALLVGLTATPKAEVDRDTYDFFCLPRNIPTFAYEYKQAIEDGHLVPVKPVQVAFKFLHDGINPEELSEEERRDYEERVRPLKGSGKVEKTALNDWLFNKNTVVQALQLLMTKGIKVQGGDTLGKTIIFARNQRHAEFIVEVFDEMYPNLKGKFIAAIHNKVDYVDKLIDDFKDKEKYPQIAVSVDMLDTGIDVPEVVNLVMFRPVFSYAKFWQMIGRGTRLCPNLFGPDQHKTHTLLFDLCGNVEYFKEFEDDLDEGSKVVSLGEQLFTQRTELIYELQQQKTHQKIHDGLVSYITNQLDALDEHHFAIRPHLSTVIQYRSPEQWKPLEPEAKQRLIQTLAPVVYDDTSEEKKRFDLLMLRLQRAALGVSKVDRIISAQKRLQTIAEQLLKKQNIKQIADQATVLKSVLRENFFAETTIEELEKVRLVIRELISLLDREPKAILYTDYTDTLKGINEDDELPDTSDLSAYKAHISEYIKKHQDHIAIQKLRKNKPITEYDLKSFENMLFHEQVGTTEQFEALFGRNGESTFGLFVRSLLGLEREAAQEAFAELLSRTSLNANQIHFINLIIDYLTKNGTLEPAQLMDEPFVSVHHEGVFGLFDEETVEEIVRLVQFVQEQAKIVAS
jgi:type I restriction enzyme, R subunit